MPEHFRAEMQPALKCSGRHRIGVITMNKCYILITYYQPSDDCITQVFRYKSHMDRYIKRTKSLTFGHLYDFTIKRVTFVGGR